MSLWNGLTHLYLLSQFVVVQGFRLKYIEKQRHYFANKGPSSQGYGFSSDHVWMWELDCEESWALKNWCFWTVVLEKTLGSPLDCKEIQPVHSIGDQPLVFFGRNVSWLRKRGCYKGLAFAVTMNLTLQMIRDLLGDLYSSFEYPSPLCSDGPRAVVTQWISGTIILLWCEHRLRLHL